MSDDRLDDESTAQKSRGGQLRLVVLGLIAAGLAAFIVQNTDSTPVTWLFFERSAPLWLVIIASAVAGAVLSELIGWMMRRRRRAGQD
ncbi:MAG: lipopolysaccharide assembly protein LapA domain-containing protein [Actinomycetota bacterium]